MMRIMTVHLKIGDPCLVTASKMRIMVRSSTIKTRTLLVALVNILVVASRFSVTATWTMRSAMPATMAKTITTRVKLLTLCRTFQPSHPRYRLQQQHFPQTKRSWSATTALLASAEKQACPSDSHRDADNGEVESTSYVNPYADPNYPDLEFVDYSDPTYMADQSEEYLELRSSTLSSSSSSADSTEEGEDEYEIENEHDDEAEAVTSTSTEEQIEAMREERRRLNDEYQFQTYFQKVLHQGLDEWRGEWTTYQSSTFLPNLANGDDRKDDDSNNEQGSSSAPAYPPLIPSSRILHVIARGYKENIPTDSVHAVDAERIRHEERLVRVQDRTDQIDPDNDAYDTEGQPTTIPLHPLEQAVLDHACWPERLSAFDFRGHQGNMVCGNAWTVSVGEPLVSSIGTATIAAPAAAVAPHLGPFSAYRAEIGVQDQDMRFRIKLHYAIQPSQSIDQDVNDVTTAQAAALPPPPLHLQTMTVCRETKRHWPRSSMSKALSMSLPTAEAAAAAAQATMYQKCLFGGPPGASGGLYDPPPVVGTDPDQANRYMLLDLNGHATVLFPHQLDQDPAAFDGYGWVTSLDWTAGKMRYQVDRKVQSGTELLGLRSLELSEVQSADADTYRPRDGGRDMRQ